MENLPADLSWLAAERVERWAGELRINLIRLVAIAAFYGHHLFNRFVLKECFPPNYSLAVTATAAIWTLGALALHLSLTNQRVPAGLRYIAVGFDVLMITSLLMVSDGPRSTLVVLLFLVVATSTLRFDLRLVWVATALTLLSYGLVCGHAKWIKPERQIPRRQQVIMVLSLSAAGVLAGQGVRQARRFAQDYADRVRPEDAP